METRNEWLRSLDPIKVETTLTKMRERRWQLNGRDWLAEASGNEGYALWLYQCDRRMQATVGLGMFDIEDWTWADGYESGMSPREAVDDALENAGFDGLDE
jgi:hypothetical protein